MFAVVEIAGKQYIVSEKDELLVDLLDIEEGKTKKVERVFLVSDAETSVGTPYVDGASVTLKSLGNEKGKKTRVFKMKAKKRYRRTQGHRQNYTRVLVTKIEFSGAKPKKATAAKKEEAPKKAPAKKAAPKKTVAKKAPAKKKAAPKKETAKK